MMPRGARLDSPGTLHHVMIRGIERRNIVTDDEDRDRFVFRMGELSLDMATAVYAWALMDNHAHILIRSGPYGLPTFMRRLLTGYAVYYNRRHKRYGHLFQNRYKSIVCEEDNYFTELVRYIHLNPIRAKIVETTSQLDRHKWCGHATVLGKRKNSWQDRDYVLKWFGETEKKAIAAYRTFVMKGIKQGRRPDLVGGGLVRSMGGWSVVKSLRKAGIFEKSDERILGSGEFSEKLLKEADNRIKRQMSLGDLIDNAQQRIAQVCEKEGINSDHLSSGSRLRKVSAVRSRLALELTKEYGLSLAESARQLGVSASAIRKIIERSR